MPVAPCYADGVGYTKVGEAEDAFYQSVDGQTFDLSGAYVTDTYYYSYGDEEWMVRGGHRDLRRRPRHPLRGRRRLGEPR